MRISQTQSDFLNLSRWVAAWLVVAEHTRSLVFVDYGIAERGMEQSGWLWEVVRKAFYFMTGFGHEAVVVFFVISGYLVGGKVWSLSRSGKFGWKRYLADRTSRLYAVLLLALLLGALMDWTGSRYFNRYGLYDMSFVAPVGAVVRPAVDALSVNDFLINAAFLQTIAGPPFGSNGPLWSLANEWWYYILFPSLAMIVLARDTWRKALGFLVAGVLVWMLTAQILWLFGLWLAGVACSLWIRRVPPPWVAAAFFVAAAVIARLELIRGFYAWQYLLGAAFSILLVSFAGRQGQFPLRRASEHLAEFSYSVYLVHFPTLMLAVSVVFFMSGYGIKVAFSPAGLAYYASIFLLAIAVSWGVSRVTEAKTPAIRGRLYEFLGIRASAGK